MFVTEFRQGRDTLIPASTACAAVVTRLAAAQWALPAVCSAPVPSLRRIAHIAAKNRLTKAGMYAAAFSRTLAATNTSNDRSALHSANHTRSRPAMYQACGALLGTNSAASVLRQMPDKLLRFTALSCGQSGVTTMGHHDSSASSRR
jgi:hypothetical protein